MTILPSPVARHRRRRRRRPPAGVVYVAVLGVAMIISIISLASLHVARVELRATGGLDQMTTAQNAANSAVELAIARIRDNSDWREDYDSGREVPRNSWTAWGEGGKLKFVIEDDDGNLDDDSRDPVTVRGIGAAGGAVAVVAVMLEPSGEPITCLDAALHAGEDVKLTYGDIIECNHFVSANIDISVGSSRTLDGDAWAREDIRLLSGLLGLNRGSVTGSRLEDMSPAREMPDAAHVFKYYIANGSRIDIASIPGRRMSQVVLNTKSNPYGAPNPQGIYVIDCQNQSLTIADSQLDATVVLLNAANPDLDDKINWQPPAPHMPALLVQGNLTMRWDGGSLVDGSLLGLLNPGNGSGDDVFPGIVKGLLYVTGDLSITNTCVLQGPVVVGGTATISRNLWISYGGSPHSFPPPGFSKGATMRIVPGTWRRTTRD